MVLGDLDSYMQKNDTWPSTYTIHKNELKIDKTNWQMVARWEGGWGIGEKGEEIKKYKLLITE